ncbi:zinc finger protein Noc-like [Ruditapes philippinarum]|uniref:zinc finger protein Noc-like n=1 Tax=Ruditapes philippinarum TaxID=129788 RepID=UPI00295BBAEF|nr:zinc finger protein Noc-like [Ruditapes philippinarum]
MNESKSESTPINMSSILSPSVAQYLHPDYLQPLPTTLDAKKSPLALLAQTCSSIGKDPSPSKPIIPPLEKEKKESEKSSDKNSSSESRKSPSNDSGNESGRDSTKKSGYKPVPPKEIPPLVPISSSSSRKSSPAPGTSSERVGETTTVTTSVSRPVSSTGSNNGHNSSSARATSTTSSERDRDSERERSDRNRDNASDNKPNRSSPDHFSSSTSKIPAPIHPGLNGFGSGLSHPGLSLYGHAFSLDPASVSSAYASSLAAAHSGYSGISASAAAALAAQNAALSKTGLTPGLSPYVSYARVRTPSGATTLVPVCRDPYCTNCQLTIQNSHVSSTCTAPGCSQCAHEKSLQSLSALGMAGASSLSMLPQFSMQSSLPSIPSGLSSYPGLTSSLYAHSLLGGVTGHSPGMPYVCNWVSGNDYCGKRYSTSEELLQHLRTHTSSSDSASSLASYAALGLPPPLGLSGYPHGPLPAHGGLSPNSLRRAYPTIPSPLSSVLSGSRYHPYKSPLPSAPTALQPGQPLSTLGPYYSPYSIYGQRVGAAAVP